MKTRAGIKTRQALLRRLAGQRHQRGVMLLEALVAILIFSIGVLGLVSLGTASVAAQSAAQYRTEAATLANEIASEITVAVDRSTPSNLATTLATFAHQPGGTTCAFSGASSTATAVTAWVNKVVPTGGTPLLPGATSAGLQIQVDTSAAVTGYNKVQVTLCWQAPSDKAVRHHTLVTYVN